jgi:nicotinamidase-related amidase
VLESIRITGGETDVCVLATVFGAIDWGFRVILVRDAVCSSADETHDATMALYTNRFGEQVETVTTDTLLESWQRALTDQQDGMNSAAFISRRDHAADCGGGN